jgi:hypothetical protein
MNESPGPTYTYLHVHTCAMLCCGDALFCVPKSIVERSKPDLNLLLTVRVRVRVRERVAEDQKRFLPHRYKKGNQCVCSRARKKPFLVRVRVRVVRSRLQWSRVSCFKCRPWFDLGLTLFDQALGLWFDLCLTNEWAPPPLPPSDCLPTIHTTQIDSFRI